MYFLVDYENQEDASLRGAEFLLPEDHLYIFYSKCCRNMARPLFETIIRSGCELKLYGSRGNDLATADDECELGYWLGKPFWGRRIMPEAVREMLRHAFEDLGMQKVWVGYYEGNEKSKRVQEKCGFKYQWKSENVDVPLMHEKRTGHVSLMTKEDWE